MTEQRQDIGIRQAPEPPRSFTGPYLASWAVLGALAVGYIGVLFTEPDWAGTLTTQSLRSEPAEVSPVVQQLTAEVGSLRRTVADLQRELDHVKTAAALRQEVEETSRLVRQENEIIISRPPLQITAAPPPETSGVVGLSRSAAEAKPGNGNPAPAPAAKVPEPVPAERPRQEETAKPAATPETPAPKKIVIVNARPTTESTERLETGSLPAPQPPEITFGPAIVTPSADTVAILLDSGPSLDALRLRWSVLHDRHQSALRDLEARYLVSGTVEQPSYQLVAGPISSAEEATRICALLRARRASCSVGGPFVGQTL